LFIDEGEIIERGTHDELFKSRGRYHDLWTKQTNAILLKASGAGDKSSETEDLLVNDLPSDSQLSKVLTEDLTGSGETKSAEKDTKTGAGADEEDNKDGSSSSATLETNEPEV